MMSRATPRRLIGRLLLSLALLSAQQAALSHTLSHVRHAESGAGPAPSKTMAADQVCGDCLAYDQFFSGVGNSPRPQTTARPVALRLPMPASAESCRHTEWMFQPRAPPQA